MSRDTRNYDGEFDERDLDGRAGPPRGSRSNGGRGPSDPSMRRSASSGNGSPRRPYGPSGGGSRGRGYPPSDSRGYAGDGYDDNDYSGPPSRRGRAEYRNGPPPGRGRPNDYDDEPPPRSRGRSHTYEDEAYSAESERAPRGRRRGLGDMAREMSRQLSAMVRGTGRAARREATQIASAGARPQLPPEMLAQVQADLPRYRRSRIRMRVRKWRLGRVRANPVAYAMGLSSLVVGVLSLLVGGGAGGVYAYNTYNVHRPAIQGIINNAISGQSTVIYDRNGVPLYTVRNQNGYNYYVPLSQMGKTIQDATIDTEDHSFYSPTNIGVDFQGTLRALIADLSHGGSAQQGGSTITQQVVKNLVLKDSNKAIQRKLNEIILAVGVNSNYSKSQILEMYLNTIDYGNLNQGIEAAARNYFGLKPQTKSDGTVVMANQQLSIAQAALLAGLPNAPTYYQPNVYSCEKAPCLDKDWANPCTNDPHDGVCTPSDTYDWQKNGHEWLVWRRSRVVLGSMLQYGAINQGQYDDALKQVHDMLMDQKILTWAGLSNGSTLNTTKRAPSFVDYILDELTNEFGVTDIATAGWKVYTTLDVNLNDYVENNVDYYINKYHTVPTCTYGDCVHPTNPPLAQTANAHDAATVAVDPYTGDVLAMVGTAKYNDKDPRVAGNYNAAVKPRSLGSSMKGIVYATALQMGWTPGIMMQDSPICMPGSGGNQDYSLTPACKGQPVYVPHNFSSDGYNGYVPVRDALADSLNVPAVEAMSFVGDTPDLSTNFISMARRLGISDAGRDENGKILRNADGSMAEPGLTPEAMGPTTALGTQSVPLIELTNAYAAMADSGKHVPYRTILRIVDSEGNTWNAPEPHPEQAISPQAAFMLTSVLSDDRARIPAFNHPNPLEFPQYPEFQVASKTGTGSGKFGPSDIITIGYSPFLAVGVWVGNANGDDMSSHVFGIAGAGYIFHDVMKWSLDHYKWPKDQGKFPIPPDMAMGAFGCNAGLAPYQGEASGATSNGTGNGNGTGTGTGTGTTGSTSMPMCNYRSDVAGHNVNVYGTSPGTPRPDTDWYIQGQAPLNS